MVGSAFGNCRGDSEISGGGICEPRSAGREASDGDARINAGQKDSRFAREGW